MSFQIIQTPRYQDIFDDKIPALEELLCEINSKNIIELLCFINAQLVLNEGDKKAMELQVKIFHLFLKQVEKSIQKQIIGKLFRFYNSAKNSFSLFAERIIQSFLHYEFGHYREVNEKDLSGEDQIKIFKAYLIFSSKLDKHHFGLINSKLDKKWVELFNWQVTTWPFIIDQFQYSLQRDITYFSFRILTFFSVLNREFDTKKYRNVFLDKIKKPTIWNYVLDLAHAAFIPYREDNRGLIVKVCNIAGSKSIEMFDNLSVNINTFEYNPKKEGDFLMLKSKPLFKSRDRDGVYWVTNWAYFAEQLYIGILKEFHQKSGINKIKSLESFPKMLSYSGSNVGEHIFQSLLKGLLSQKHRIIHWDDSEDDSKGIPDFYFRDGKHLFLFEFKDSLMGVKTIDSFDFETIRKDIHLKFVEKEDNKEKGILQICKQIIHLNKNCFPFDQFNKKKLKRRNMEVYPILVYSHTMYSMPGIREYIEHFKTQYLKKHQADLEFKIIHETIMIELETLYRMVVLNINVDFKSLIQSYLKALKNHQNFINDGSVSIEIGTEPSFEYFNRKFLSRNGRKPDIQRAFDLVGFEMN